LQRSASQPASSKAKCRDGIANGWVFRCAQPGHKS
jgi:hypothetical protein